MCLSLLGWLAMTTKTTLFSCRLVYLFRCGVRTHCIAAQQHRRKRLHRTRQRIKIIHTSSHIAAHQVHEFGILRCRCASGTISIECSFIDSAGHYAFYSFINEKHEQWARITEHIAERWQKQGQRNRFRSTFSISFMILIELLSCAANPRTQFWSPNGIEYFSRAISAHLFRDNKN